MGASKGEYGCNSPVTFPKLVLLVSTEEERNKLIKPALEKCGLIGRQDIWVVKTGIGKVNATLSTAMMLTAINSLDPKRFSECMFVNVGLCAANEFAFKSSQAVQIDEVFDGDRLYVSVYEKEEPFTKVCPPPLSLSTRTDNIRKCLSQDMFDGNFITDFDSNPYYCDFELFGIAAACKQFGVRLTALKSVSCVVKKFGDDYTYESVSDADVKIVDLLANYLNSNIDVILK